MAKDRSFGGIDLLVILTRLVAVLGSRPINRIEQLRGPGAAAARRAAGLRRAAPSRAASLRRAYCDNKITMRCNFGEEVLIRQTRVRAGAVAQAIIGILFSPPKTLRSFGRKIVWVVRLLSPTSIALQGPVPPSSTVREVVSVVPLWGGASTFGALSALNA